MQYIIPEINWCVGNFLNLDKILANYLEQYGCRKRGREHCSHILAKILSKPNRGNCKLFTGGPPNPSRRLSKTFEVLLWNGAKIKIRMFQFWVRNTHFPTQTVFLECCWNEFQANRFRDLWECIFGNVFDTIIRAYAIHVYSRKSGSHTGTNWYSDTFCH